MRCDGESITVLQDGYNSSMATSTATVPSTTHGINKTPPQVRLREHGSELIEVSDNGSGIQASDWEAVGLKYHTSKLSAFEDLQVGGGFVVCGCVWVCLWVCTHYACPIPHPQHVGTFGFRGEAISSLCAVAQVSIITKTAHAETAVGWGLRMEVLGIWGLRECKRNVWEGG